MKHLIKTSLAFAVMVALVGCAGNGGPTLFSDTDFVGDWSGTWTSNSTLAGSGTAMVSIDEDGNFTGTSVQTGGSSPATLTGTMMVNGTFSGTLQFSSGSPIAATGTFTNPSTNTLTGTLIQGTGSNTLEINYTMNRN